MCLIATPATSIDFNPDKGLPTMSVAFLKWSQLPEHTKEVNKKHQVDI